MFGLGVPYAGGFMVALLKHYISNIRRSKWEQVQALQSWFVNEQIMQQHYDLLHPAKHVTLQIGVLIIDNTSVVTLVLHWTSNMSLSHTWDTFYEHGLTLVSAWIGNHMPSKVWGEITYPFLNFNGAAIEVCEWISNFIPHFIMDVITYPCWN